MQIITEKLLKKYIKNWVVKSSSSKLIDLVVYLSESIKFQSQIQFNLILIHKPN